MLYSTSRSAGLVLALVAVILLVASPACAAGPAQQAGPVGGIYNWYALAPGQSVEWVFHYPGHGDAALIAFGIDPANTIAINVYTDEQWRSLGAGIWPVEPVGRGTPGTLDAWSDSQDLINSGSLFWEAVAWPEVIFHIQMTNASQGEARYGIAQDGPGAGQLAPYAPIAPLSAPAAAPAAAPAPVAASDAPPPQTLPVTGAALRSAPASRGLTGGCIWLYWKRLDPAVLSYSLPRLEEEHLCRTRFFSSRTRSPSAREFGMP